MAGTYLLLSSSSSLAVSSLHVSVLPSELYKHWLCFGDDSDLARVCFFILFVSNCFISPCLAVLVFCQFSTTTTSILLPSPYSSSLTVSSLQVCLFYQESSLHPRRWLGPPSYFLLYTFHLILLFRLSMSGRSTKHPQPRPQFYFIALAVAS